MPSGDRDRPVATTPGTVSPGCYWWTDPDGALCLMPGCMARIQDPGADCTCATLQARLQRIENKQREREAADRYARRWWDALSDAVKAHPDAQSILADARRRTGR